MLGCIHWSFSVDKLNDNAAALRTSTDYFNAKISNFCWTQIDSDTDSFYDGDDRKFFDGDLGVNNNAYDDNDLDFFMVKKRLSEPPRHRLFQSEIEKDGS
jgi:hypothetical protein